MYLSPFTKSSHDVMSQLCQFQIFFALLAGVVLKTDPTELESEWLGNILTVMCAVPPLIGLAFNNDRLRSLFDKKHRQKLAQRLSKYLGPIWRWLSTRCRRKSKVKAAGAFQKSMKSANAKNLTRARTITNFLGEQVESKQLHAPTLGNMIKGVSKQPSLKQPSLLDQIKQVNSKGSAVASHVEAPTLLKKVAFFNGAADAARPASPSSPFKRARVFPGLPASPGRPDSPAPVQHSSPAQVQLNLERHLASPRQPAAKPKFTQVLPTSGTASSCSDDIAVSDV